MITAPTPISVSHDGNSLAEGFWKTAALSQQITFPSTDTLVERAFLIKTCICFSNSIILVHMQIVIVTNTHFVSDSQYIFRCAPPFIKPADLLLGPLHSSIRTWCPKLRSKYNDAEWRYLKWRWFVNYNFSTRSQASFSGKDKIVGTPKATDRTADERWLCQIWKSFISTYAYCASNATWKRILYA